MSKAVKKTGPKGFRKYKPYPAYKDSGVEWLGEVPEHWGMKRLKEYVRVINGYPFESNKFSKFDGIPLVRIRDLGADKTSIFYDGYEVVEALINNGDILIGMDGDFDIVRWQGGRALLNQRVCCLLPSLKINSQFVFYMMTYPLKVINDLSYSTTVKHLSSYEIGKINFGLPTVTEQNLIVEFLDYETAKIDDLIAKQKQLIKLLQEKRAALITQAVTKGLDPNVPMKDSGVEWLGEIPAHWDVLPFKRLGEFRGGSGFPDYYQGYKNKELPFYKVSDTNIYSNEIYMKVHNNSISRKIARGLNADILPKGTIIFPKVGAALLLNKRRILTKPSCIDNNMAGFISKSGDVRWLYYWMCGLDLGRLANPGAVPSVNENQMRNIMVPVPPKMEQKAIGLYLTNKILKIDDLIKKVSGGITLLKEYRSALISAAVTGKIDVRQEVS